MPSIGDTYELDAIDVGTGLSVLVKGPDFTLLYDAGSNDDLARGDANRVMAFLKALHPEVGVIDHLVISHPHRDHVELMADVVLGHGAHDVWDSGAYNDICGYRAFLRAVANDSGAIYHDANLSAGSEQRPLPAKNCYGEDDPLGSVVLQHGNRITTEPMSLGAHANMQFLHVDGSKHSNLNDNSLVLRLQLGSRTVLLMGDAEAGSRAAPTTPPTPMSVEGQLLACCADRLRADVMVVGHHGSMSSSRTALLDAVGASYYIVSSGPTKYGDVVLPDKVVIDALTNRGKIFETDIDDAACRQSTTKIGRAIDDNAGGCNSVQVTIAADAITAKYVP